MAELVGGALLSGFLNVLFDRMASKEIVEFFRGKKAIPKLLKELKTILNSANALLNDAEEKQLRDQNVKNWLEELKDLIFDIDHAIEKINTEALRCEIEEGGQPESMTATKCLTCFPIRSSLFDRAVIEELEKILARLELLLKQSDHLGLNQNIKRSSTVASSLAPLVEESDVYGRETEKKSLIELLLSDDVSLPKISVIPIVGMGGIGKTTLAQVVYNDAGVQKHFDFKVWVTVSEDFDVPRLMKLIYKSITSKKCEIEDPKAIQSELYEALRGKKFLFVHDDVWNEEYELWDVLNSAFQSGVHGSKIIVTTRSGIVAKQMGNVERPYHLDVISEADCWMLFRKHVVGNVDEHSDWKEMGIQFVKKCKGLPLAVKSIAGLLRSMMRPETWREILESDIWDFREVNSTKVLPALWLSYSFLPPNLKRCFAFLSVFPKDYVFDDDDKEKIILMWMAEGLLQPQNNRRAEDVGKEYLNVLVSRSFFQVIHHRWARSEPDLIMHDLIHDLALFVSSNSSNTRYCSLKQTSEDFIKLEKSTDTMFLRTLMIIPPRLQSTLAQNVLGEVLPKVGCLRELCFSKSQIKVLPDSIGTLKHLRYLDLSETEIEELPASLCSLYNLQTLLLTKCQKLRCLPTDLSRLIKLRHLDIKGASLLKELPPQICKLKDLQALCFYVISERSNIKDLGELRLLRGNFCLRQLQNVISADEALGADMKNKKYIAKIRFEWDIEDPEKDTEVLRALEPHSGIQKLKINGFRGTSTCEDLEKDTEVLRALEPHSGIQKLKINGFRGTKLPNWVAEQSFREIVKVSLIDCRNCCSLPPLGELASLKILRIRGMNGVVSVGDEFSGTTTNPFPSLEELKIEEMSSWENWSFSGSVSLFPRLKELTILNCDKLKCGLPKSLGAESFRKIVEVSLIDCRNCSSLPPLGELASLKILRIRGMNGVVSVGDEFSGTTRNPFPTLETLEIQKMSSWENWSFSGSVWLFPRLEQLTIEECDKLKCGLPKSLGAESFREIVEVSLIDCRNCTSLPPLGELASVKILRIRGMNGVVSVGDEFSGTTRNPFPSLERLVIKKMSSWEKWSFSGSVSLFPRLKYLTIEDCDKLKCGLPNCSTLPALESVSIIGCKSMELFSSLPSTHLPALESVWSCLKLILNRLSWGLHRLSSLRKLILGDYKDDSFPEEGLLPNGFQRLTALSELSIRNCKQLQCLPPQGLPLSLNTLRIDGCPLLNNQCERETGNYWPKIQHIPQIFIDYKQI